MQAKKSTDTWFPVVLLDDTDGKTAETGVAFGDVTCKYYQASSGATSLQTYSVTTDDWKEAGEGMYSLRIGASEFANEGIYEVSVDAAVARTYRFPVEVADKTHAEVVDDIETIDGIVDDILVDTGTTIPDQISGLNDLSAADVNAEVDTALADYDPPTNTEMEARTLVAASYATATGQSALAGGQSTIDGKIDGLNNLSSADVNAACDTALADYDGPTNAEMEARTLVAANYFDPAADTVAHVTLVDTTTTNTDMRGTDSAATASALATHDGKLDTVDANVDSVLEDTGTTIPGLISALNNLSTSDVEGITIDSGMDLAATLKRLLAVLDGATTVAGSGPYVHTIRDKTGSTETTHSITTGGARTVS